MVVASIDPANALATAGLTVGRTRIERHPGDLTVTRLHDGAEVLAVPHDTPAYAGHAHELGYGSDVARMSFEHELVHSLLANWLGLPESPVMRAVAEGTWQHDPDGALGAEEAAVLAIQTLCNKLGVRFGHLQAGAAGVRPG